jgi:hypothetical protein
MGSKLLMYVRMYVYTVVVVAIDITHSKALAALFA